VSDHRDPEIPQMEAPSATPRTDPPPPAAGAALRPGGGRAEAQAGSAHGAAVSEEAAPGRSAAPPEGPDAPLPRTRAAARDDTPVPPGPAAAGASREPATPDGGGAATEGPVPGPCGGSPPQEAAGARDAREGAAPADPEALREAVIDAIRTCYDPEIPVNIYEMGLVYEVEVTPEGDARIVMTLTSPMCPVAETLPFEVENKVAEVPGIRSARVEVTWDPPWDPSMMSDAARLELGMM